MLHYIQFLLTRGFIDLFRFVPFGALYKISDGLAFLLYRVVRYRKPVVMDNLRRCFPDKPEADLERIAKESYRNLSDIIMESLKGATLPISEIKSRYVYTNYGLMNQYLDAGQSIVLAGGHYNNWEWGVITIASGLHGSTIGVYKPLSNQYTDQWFFRNRSRDGHMILKSMKDTFASVTEYKGKAATFILVADQIPSNRKTAIPARFFGQPTACLPGTETIAVQNNYPVMMYEVERVKRGHYALSFSEVCLNPAEVPFGTVTQLFMDKMEEQIRRQPENWLWSHKRWKWMPDLT